VSDNKSHATLTYLYRVFGQRILKLVLKRNGGNLAAAEQVLQDTFVSAYTSFHTFHHKSTYFTWLCKIALNKLADYYRQQVHQNSRIVIPTIAQFNTLIDPALTSEERLVLEELRNDVNRSLNLLPEDYRRLLHLKYYQQLSNREISLRLNLSPRKIEGRLYRARHRLASVIAAASPHLKPR